MTTIEIQKFRNIRKMPAMFKTDHVKHETIKEINPAAAWIFTEKARPTTKVDGTSITVMADGTAYARRMVKKGKKAPEGFILAELDKNTGHQFGLIPVMESSFKKLFIEARDLHDGELTEGTYELVGPKINGNPEKVAHHTLIPHGGVTLTDFPDMRDFAHLTGEELFDFLLPIFDKFRAGGIEGVVWWGADDKRAKLRVTDFFGDPNRRF